MGGRGRWMKYLTAARRARALGSALGRWCDCSGRVIVSTNSKFKLSYSMRAIRANASTAHALATLYNQLTTQAAPPSSTSSCCPPSPTTSSTSIPCDTAHALLAAQACVACSHLNHLQRRITQNMQLTASAQPPTAAAATRTRRALLQPCAATP